MVSFNDSKLDFFKEGEWDFSRRLRLIGNKLMVPER